MGTRAKETSWTIRNSRKNQEQEKNCNLVGQHSFETFASQEILEKREKGDPGQDSEVKVRISVQKTDYKVPNQAEEKKTYY